jgi:hypothetical protein
LAFLAGLILVEVKGSIFESEVLFLPHPKIGKKLLLVGFALQQVTFGNESERLIVFMITFRCGGV